MIRNILYSLLILIFFGFLLVSGLMGPQQGKLAVERFLEFLNWNPPRKSDSLLTDTEIAIRQFNENYAKVRVLRQMTLERSEKLFEELEGVYKQMRENLKVLLTTSKELTPEDRAALYEKFSVMHTQRAELVDQIIRDQIIMININEQMDQQLQVMGRWLNDKAGQLNDPTTKDMRRMQQYENLKANLKAFNEESSSLDSMRILFMKKNKETVERLAETNKELEIRFRELLAQIQLSTQQDGYDLWDRYQQLETEQKELVGNLRTTEEFIGANQAKLINGVVVISKSVEYRSDTQLQRFRDSYHMMEQRRREMVEGMTQRQQVFVSSQPTRKQLREESRYRMEMMREHARQISSQYEQMEEIRRSTASMIQKMSAELKDKSEFISRQNDDVMQRNRDKIDSFMTQMDATQQNIKQFIENSQQTELADSAAIRQMKDLQNKSKFLLENMKSNEDNSRSLRIQSQRDQNAISQIKRDAERSNMDRVRSARERSEDQKRMLSERIKEQIRNAKDRQESLKSASQ